MSQLRDSPSRWTPAAPAAFALVLVGVSLLAWSCASIRNTPAQDLAYERFRVCETRVLGVQVYHVEPNGRIWFYHQGPWERARVIECLNEAGRGGQSLPEPLPLQTPRGG